MLKKILAGAFALIMTASVAGLSAYADFNMDESGKLYYETSDGKSVSGWQEINGQKYYIKNNGEVMTRSTTINGIRYRFTSNGICKGAYTGFVKSGSGRCYYLKGIKQIGWCKIDDNWHYFDKNGIHAEGRVQIMGKEYNFSESGVWDGKTEISSAKVVLTLDKKLDKDIFGGTYLDDGMATVMSVDSEKVSDAVDTLFPNFAPIVLVDCEYSCRQLEYVRKQFADIMSSSPEFGIHSICTDVINNRIVVGTEEISQQLENFIRNSDYNDCIYVEISDLVIIDD